MQGLKESGQAVGAELLTQLAGFAPPTVLSQASRLQSAQRAFNVVVTNVPGPQFPLYMLGRRLLRIYPQVPLVRNTALGIAIMSYDGTLNFGPAGRLRRAARPRRPRRRAERRDRRAGRGGGRRRAAAASPVARHWCGGVLGGLLVVLSLAAVIGLVLVLQSRDDAQVGERRRARGEGRQQLPAHPAGVTRTRGR